MFQEDEEKDYTKYANENYECSFPVAVPKIVLFYRLVRIRRLAYIRYHKIVGLQFMLKYCNVLGVLYSRWNFIALQKSIHYS
jgi:hypothetical protein